jgi:hypothetical protein
MKNLTQLKTIANSSGYKLKFTGDYDSNGKDKLYAMYSGKIKQSLSFTVAELNNRPFFKSE